MEDTVISAQVKKRELSIFAGCLVLALLLNAYAIASYGTSWSEMYSMIGMVVSIAVAFYVLQGLIRLVIYGLLHLFR
jgi:hypothetical protein